MNLIILCAGYGTRLYPLTKNTAKPLLPINDKPIIEYIIDSLIDDILVEKIFIITNEKFYSDFCTWEKAFRSSYEIVVVNDGTKSDDDKLGAIGDMRFLIEQQNISGETLVVAGDNIFDFPLDPFFELVKEKNAPAVIGAFDVGNRTLAKQYGILALDQNRRVFSFLEKPEDPPSTFASLALYHFSAEGVELINTYLEQGGNKDQPGHYIRWLVDNYDVYAYVFTGHWFDIGDIDSYNQANEFYKHRT